MARLSLRAVAALVSIPLVVTAVVTADSGAAPAPRPGQPAVELPAGPWPPARVLAADPEQVAAPVVTAAVVNPRCPAAPYGVRSAAPGAGKTVALTFDDGPGRSTRQLLDILQRAGVASTFFNIGVNQTTRPTEVRSEAVLEAPLGNHSWSHPRMPTLSAAAQAQEMDRTSARQQALVGQAPCMFRPPYGEYNATTLTLAQQRRMSVWNWSVDTEDWKAGTSTDPAWVNRIVTRAQAGGSQQHPVILMHNPPAGLPATVTALPRIISYYRTRGYTFVDLLGHTGQQPAPAAAVTTAGRHLAVRAPGGAVHYRTGTGTTWTAWRSLGGTIVGGPAAIAATPTSTVLFATASTNEVQLATVRDNGSVTGWASLGGILTSKPGAAVGPDGRIAVVARGTTGAAFLKEKIAGQWGGWQNIGGVLASAPAVAITADGGLTVAMVGMDGALWVRHRAGATWAAWRRIRGVITTEPALSASAGGDRLVAMFSGTTGAVYAPTLDAAATQYLTWPILTGRLVSGPALAVDGTAVDAVGYGTTGRLYLNVATAGATASGWSGWQVLPA